MNVPQLVSWAIDVGSTKSGAFAWARATATDNVQVGTSMDVLLEFLNHDLRSGGPVAFGVEAPLFLPFPDASAGLSSGRTGEGSRSCFAPAGAGVTTLGIHQLGFIVLKLAPEREVTIDWRTWSPKEPGPLLIWEAFVSEGAHSKEHTVDAATAAVEFLRLAEMPWPAESAVNHEGEVISLVAAALLRVGRSNIDDLARQCLVVRPRKAFDGVLRAHPLQPAKP